MAETVTEQPHITARARRQAEDDIAAARLAKVRDRIRKNFPDGRAALTWRRDSPTRLVSGCGRFSIEKHGEGDAVRYTAKLQPHAIIGNRRYTLEEAKEDCCRHASPLPLEPKTPPAPEPVVEREPGSDDE